MDILNNDKKIQKRNVTPGNAAAFSLVELLLVVTIIGIILALVIPKASRAKIDSQFSLIRQNCNEISMKIVTYAEELASTQRPSTSFTIKDILYTDITGDEETTFTSKKLVDKYTGNQDFDVVENCFSGENSLKNPFNGTNYFSYINNDISIPSRKTGLVYFMAGKSPRAMDYLEFYLLITDAVGEGKAGKWYGNMDMTPGAMRHGIFVAKLYDDQEYGGVELDSEVILERSPDYISSSGKVEIFSK
ncbi:type II secretion system protein [Desulfobacula sp.]|uniref:type II secretion system protein n=1 Tax=Desulfobacula sp. TaxID=2593537 RepID=UPI00262D5B30|nr:type II secretion system protein [Desulfobacula sp.]